MNAEKRLGLWKASWFSPHWNEVQGATYSTREAAIRRVRSQLDEGCTDGRVWQKYHGTNEVAGAIEFIR